MRLDASEDSARRLALTGLLLDVVDALGVLVRRTKDIFRRHRLQLHVPAGRAADDVAQSGAEPIRAGDQAIVSDLICRPQVPLETHPAAGRTLTCHDSSVVALRSPAFRRVDPGTACVVPGS